MIQPNTETRPRRSLLKTLFGVSILTLVLAVGFALVIKPHSAAAATANSCAVPTGGGTDSFDQANTSPSPNGINVPATGTYYLWLRMESPDGTNHQLSVSVDGGTCFTLGATMAANTWTWVDVVAGTSNPATYSLTQGYHTMVITGANGVSLDTFLFTQQTPAQCTPTGITSATDCEPALPVTVPYYLQSGGQGFTDSQGHVWAADQYYTMDNTDGGTTIGGTGVEAGDGSGTCNTIATTNTNCTDEAITGTPIQHAYQTERWGDFHYDIPVANGNYTVVLLFAEINPASGTRVSDVSIEGTQVLTNFNIAAQVGNYAADNQPFPVTVTNNDLNITLTAVTGGPKLSGIEVLPSSPPNVSISAPTSGSTYSSGTAVTLTAAATDASSTPSVQFQVDGVNVGSAITAAPYSTTWTAPTTSGTYTITAIATAGGVSTTSAPITVTVANNTCTGTPNAPSNLKDPDTTLPANKVDLSWTAGSAAANCTLEGYNVYRGTTTSNLTKITATPVTGTTYSDTTVAAGTTYYYQITSVDSTGTAPESAKVPATPLSVTTGQNCTSSSTNLPSTPTLTATGGVSYTSIPLSWTASTVTNGCTLSGYHVYRVGDATPIYTGTALNFTDTGVGLTPANLDAGIKYSYTVVAYDSGGNDSLAGAASATTEADNEAPTLPSAPAASGITSASATLTWGASTDLPNPGGTGVGGYNIYRCTGANCSTFTTAIASVSATTLTYTDTTVAPSTTYDYVITAFDKATPPNEDKTASATLVPVVTPAAPVNCTANPTAPGTPTQGTTTMTSMVLNWTAGKAATGCTLSVYKVFDATTNTVVATPASNTATISSLQPNTTYNYYVEATDTNSHASTPTATVSFKTSPDTQAPTPPTNFTATAASGLVNLSWGASTDNVGVADYVITRTTGTTTITLPTVTPGTATSDQDTTVSPSTTYTYKITAFDTSGNPSTTVSAPAVTTPAATCNVAPSAPTALNSSVTTATAESFSWNASTVPAGSGCTISGYKVYRATAGGSPVLISGSSYVTTASYADSGLSPSTQYSYTVVGYDNANLPSPSSAALPITTLTSTGTPVPGDLNGDGKVDFTDFTILVVAWDTNQSIVVSSGGDTSFNGPVNFTVFTRFVIDWDNFDL